MSRYEAGVLHCATFWKATPAYMLPLFPPKDIDGNRMLELGIDQSMRDASYAENILILQAAFWCSKLRFELILCEVTG